MFAFVLVPYLHGMPPALSQPATEPPAVSLPASAPVTSEPLAAPKIPTRPTVPFARGFGRDVPLAFAARQIVPARLSVGFGRGVDPERHVNWQGGRPWPTVLSDVAKATDSTVRFTSGRVDFLSNKSR